MLNDSLTFLLVWNKLSPEFSSDAGSNCLSADLFPLSCLVLLTGFLHLGNTEFASL